MSLRTLVLIRYSVTRFLACYSVEVEVKHRCRLCLLDLESSHQSTYSEAALLRLEQIMRQRVKV